MNFHKSIQKYSIKAIEDKYRDRISYSYIASCIANIQSDYIRNIRIDSNKGTTHKKQKKVFRIWEDDGRDFNNNISY